MVKIGLDIGTGFVKCVSDYCRFKFPSLYARRINGRWTDSISEAVGDKAAHMLKTRGTTAISPICKGRPEKRYQKQVDLLVRESINRVYRVTGTTAAKTVVLTEAVKTIPLSPEEEHNDKARVVVGLPYEAAHYKKTMLDLICKVPRVGSCDVVAQAAGTLVAMNKNNGMVVSIGQGTSEIVMIEDNRIIDGQSLEWASEFITRKIGKFAHLDTKLLLQHKDVCAKYAKALTENLAVEIIDMASAHGYKRDIIVSGGGILIPRVRQELSSKLKKFKIVVPEDPVMSNAIGLYKLAE